MSTSTWSQAIVSLFTSFGLNTNNIPKQNKERLNEALYGTGLTAKRVNAVNNNLSLGSDVSGILFQDKNGSWNSAIVLGEEIYLLDDNGKPCKIIDSVASNAEGYVWTFFKKKTKQENNFSSFLKRFKSPLIEILISGFVINLFSLSLPLFSSFVYDKVLGNGITETLWALAIGLVIIVLIDFSVRLIRTIAAERFAVSSEADIDYGVFQSILSANSKNLPTIGRFLDKYKQILSSRDFLSSSYLLAFVDVPFLLLFLVTIFYIAGPLVFITIGFGVLMLLGNIVTYLPISDYDKNFRLASEKRFRFLTDLLMSHEVAAKSHLRKELMRGWKTECSNASLAQSKVRYWRSFGSAIVTSLTFICYAAIIIGGVYMVEVRELTSGGLLAASILSSRAMTGFSSIIMIVLRYKEFKISMKELDKILPAPLVNVSQPSRGRFNGNLSFRKVCCRLGDNDVPILSSIDLEFKPGEMVGIAGVPGAGKTTLLRLSTGNLLPDEGKVLIDNIPIEKLSLDDISNNIGYKPQELCLIEGTIEDNVRAGRAQFSALQREYILSASGLGFAFKESGLNWTTQIGSRGENVSGGQRQLIALARAMAGTPSLLLLDEPTNGLSVELETHLANQLIARKDKSTIIISTHSRNLLSKCDRIIVIGQSRILADGPRDKILVA